MVVDRVFGFLGLIMGITALAIIISKKSNTTSVLSSLLTGINNLQKTAISPVTGN